MRKSLVVIAVMILSLATAMGQRQQVTLPANGDWPETLGDSVMLIGPKQDALSEKQVYFNPPYLLVYPGKEHLKEQMIRACACDCDPTKPNRRIGVFSVAPDKQVSFSQGNLQYLPAANIWKFANTQYEYLGNANKYLKPTFRNWVDLFGWSANNTTAPFGVSTSTNAADYAGEFVDWGINPICGDTPGTWRTMSVDEWMYILHERANADQLFALGKIDGVSGVIILPDDWQMPEGLHFIPSSENGLQWNTQNGGMYMTIRTDYSHYDDNEYTLLEWQKMEGAGAVFLPAAGYRKTENDEVLWSPNQGYLEGTSIGGSYFTYTKVSSSQYYFFRFCDQEIRRFPYYFDRGRSVRLVHDTIVPPPAPCDTFEVNGVTFNMMCVEGGTFIMSEGRTDAHQVTLSDYYIGQTEVTQALWKAVMGEVPAGQAILGDDYPVANISLADCRLFVERLSELTGRHFRIPTEAEWEYAARGGKHSKGFTYAGSDDINEVAWYVGNKTEHKPKPVKCFKPNELGIYDMSGNMGEWVSDWNAPYNLYPQVNPTGAAIHSTPGWPYTYRGGAWGSDANNCTPTSRQSHQRATYAITLRLVMSDEEPFRAVYLNDTTRFYLRPVKKGTFMMGSREDDPIIQQRPAAKADELPQRKVTLDSDYWVAEYELTQAIWTAVMGTDVYDLHAALTKPTSDVIVAGPGYPMYFVYTKDVFEFTRRLSKLTGINFRLPTEAEWEFAARGGNLSHGYLYAGSNNPDSVAWYSKGTTTDVQTVGQKMPNELGIYDMSGNVLERCVDYLEYHQPYDPNDTINPRGKLQQSGNRAYRGGAYNMHKDSVRVTHRAPQTPTFTSKNVGTRVVVNDEHHFQTFKVGSVWFDMIFVKGGTFQMGATEEQGSEAAAHEFPVHEVTLSDYYIGQIEVTQRLWQTVMGSSNNPSTIKDSNKPVNNVTWEECQVFVEKLSQMTGYYFRLPTEAEWEFAARGGNKSKGYKYAGSDNVSDVAWYTNNSGGTTHTFATKQPNELGIYDMSGNVWEWCYDWYGPYSAEAQVDPTGPETGEYHMYRGGGWTYVENDCRVARRRQTESYNKEFLGLRLAMNQDAMIPLPEPDPVPTPGRRIGVFSVAKDKQVSFSQGNLQYIQSKDKWQFAPDQLYITGNRHYQDGALADTIMYFGWSGKNSNAPWGISLSINSTDYEGEFLDWGTNIIGGDTANTWRTTSDEEWNYMLRDRKNADKLHAIARVDTINGLILLPDDWILPEGMHFEPTIEMVESNQYTLSEWSVMENAGAVFMPMSGYFNHKLDNMRKLNVEGYVRSNNLLDGRQVYSVFKTGKLVFSYQGNNTANLFYGFPVRLVRDTIIPQYVDLGLSVKWANYNLGASTPTGVGDYYAWGETEPKDSYMPANYQWSMGSAETYTKYCTVDSMGYNGFTDGLTTLQPQDDAAQMQKGGHWRMPSDAEWEELIKNCTWTQAEQGGQIGYIATSKINGNGIFIPVAGFRSIGNVVLDYLGAYWSSSLNESKQSCAYGLYINKDEDRVGRYSNSCREYGFLIRPVYDENYHAYVDLGLSVKWATTNVGAETPEQYGDYYAWGETEPKETYGWATYKWGTSSNLTKYNTTDGKTVLDLDDDAAYVNWGGNWRMPSKEEVNELTQQCSWIWTTHNNVYGYKVTGPNGNSIFLPAAGYKGAGPTYTAGEDGLYWTITLEKGHYSYLIVLHNDAPPTEASTKGTRCFGFTIRPVYDDVEKHYRNGITQANWDAANSPWGHGGRGHAPTN